jgi:DNA-binding SARP family transcriptional activator
MDTIRKNLGRRDILSKKGDFYQLEDTWTDLGELEDLLRRTNATADPTEREELLSRARELARGELLPEFPYDKHIEEYRNYYERLRKNLGLAKD